MIRSNIPTTATGMLTHISKRKAITETVKFFIIVTSMPLVDIELNKLGVRQMIKGASTQL